MRLGFYYHVPVIQKNGGIFLPGYLGRFLEELANNFTEVVLFLHRPNPGENAFFDYRIQATNVSLVLLPPRKSVPYRLFNKHAFETILKQHTSSLDALMLRGPTYLLPAFVQAAGSIPVILLIVGDYLAGVNSLRQRAWRKLLIRLLAVINYYGQLKAAKNSLVFVNSHLLYVQFLGKIDHLHETHTTTLTKEDFFYREDTCQGQPIHLLYTGRMDLSKGLLDMVKALSILVQSGFNVVLDLVGWSEKGSDVFDLIFTHAQQLGVKERIKFHGYKMVGSELFNYYKEADIYILASQSSFEGFPRTLWEAMAHCLPVVATKVGSIPDYISSCAELVDPKNPLMLAEAISRVISYPSLRQAHISQGYSLAQQNILEIQVSGMAKEISAWLQDLQV